MWELVEIFESKALSLYIESLIKILKCYIFVQKQLL